MKATVAQALAFLQGELSRLGARQIILSSNYTLGIQSPKDPGVCAFFELRGKRYAIPCDRWDKIEHNIQAIALTVEAMRGMDRWGAKNMIEAMFSGFKALPEPKASRPWWEVLGVLQTESYASALDAYRQLAKRHHPDVGGSVEVMSEINAAWNQARKEMGFE